MKSPELDIEMEAKYRGGVGKYIITSQLKEPEKGASVDESKVQ